MYVYLFSLMALASQPQFVELQPCNPIEKNKSSSFSICTSQDVPVGTKLHIPEGVEKQNCTATIKAKTVVHDAFDEKVNLFPVTTNNCSYTPFLGIVSDELVVNFAIKTVSHLPPEDVSTSMLLNLKTRGVSEINAPNFKIHLSILEPAHSSYPEGVADGWLLSTKKGYYHSNGCLQDVLPIYVGKQIYVVVKEGACAGDALISPIILKMTDKGPLKYK